MVGPTVYLMRADSATVASVWSRNTMTKTKDSDAAYAARGASNPVPFSPVRRVRAVFAMARAPTSSGASAIKPCGASVTLNIATTIAAAAGHDRRAPIAYSTSTSVSSTPNAMRGSGRRPLLNGSHAATKTAAPVQTATRLSASRRPRRGMIQRLSSSQVAVPASRAGNRIHTPAVLMAARCASIDWYQSNGASVAPK